MDPREEECPREGWIQLREWITELVEDPILPRNREAYRGILVILGHETPEETETRGQWVAGLQLMGLRVKTTCGLPLTDPAVSGVHRSHSFPLTWLAWIQRRPP